MATYKTPGVYLEEISKLPPSVAEVETAIPAFIGYTQLRGKSGNAMEDGVEVARISSMVEYESFFGTTNPASIKVTVLDSMDGNNVKSRKATAVATEPAHTLYYHMAMFFANGGGACYIVSVGDEATTLKKADFAAGLKAIAKYDEPTLLVMPEAVNMVNSDITSKRTTVATKKTALYNLQLTADAKADDLDTAKAALAAAQKVVSDINAAGGTPTQAQLTAVDDAEGAVDDATGNLDDAIEALSIADGEAVDAQEDLDAAIVAYAGVDMNDLYVTALKQAADLQDRFVIMDCYNDDYETLRDGVASANLKYGAAYHPFLKTTVNYLYESASVTISYRKDTNGNGRYSHVIFDGLLSAYAAGSDASKDVVINVVQQAIANLGVTLNPSAAIAGIYAYVDSTRGVWKAPANVGLNYVSGLTKQVDDSDQALMNVDTTAGKSVNAIRVISGKGILVWGARTLAGNDNEWRYVSVRRFFNMAEESIRKATASFVFEANDANTWTKLQGMIENYLLTLWRAGALQGAKPEHAFYVAVGLNKTMTPQDVLEGRLYIEVGLAAVRPAEFIVLRFSHMLAQS